MKITPLNDGVFLSEVKESVTKSGIVLPESNRSGIYRIYAIGKNSAQLKKGMKVLASRHIGEELELKDGAKTNLLKYCPVDSLLAIIHD